MRREERLVAILDLLAQEGNVEVSDIVDAFGISAATARRDLDVLAERNLLHRTHGGASAQSLSYDLPLRYKRNPRTDAKAAIAAAVQELIDPRMRVGLSGGTTSTAIAAELAQRSDLEARDGEGITVVTNAINIAAQLVIRPHIRVVVTGGVAQMRSYELTGPYSDLMLERITLDRAFIGTNAIDVLNGPMVADEREARVNALMAERAEQAWIVADSSKIGRRGFARVGEPGLFHGIVTDIGITAAQRRDLMSYGLEVIAAQ